MDVITRAEWGARKPRGSYGRLTATRGVKIHYTGGHVDPQTLTDHSRCVAAVRGIQSGHLDGNGWIDIGYSLVACAHRKVFVGRGPGHLPAANGAGLNSDHYAVLGLVGTSGVTTPPDGMLHGIRDAIEWLRAEGGAGLEIKGHRDGYSTSCPGGPLYAWVRAGAPRPDQEDDVSAKDIWVHELKVPFGSPENPEWQAGNVLVNTAKWVKETRGAVAVLGGQLDAQGVAIRELAAALAAHHQEIDADALIERIEAAIERVAARLDVGDPATP